MAELFLGIDLGTSGCRAVLLDGAGEIQAESRAALPPSVGEGPNREQDPHAWWRAMVHAVRMIEPQTFLGRVVAMAVDGTSGTLLLADAHGAPCTPGLMYNDARATVAARLIAEHAPRETGATGVSSSLAKLLYLKAGTPIFSYALHQADWLLGRLTGRFGISDENNALKLGYDPVSRTWPAWLDELEAPLEAMPRVYPPGVLVGGLLREAAEALALPIGTAVATGTTDSVAGWLAAGADAPGDAVTSLGSTLAIKLVSSKPVFAPAQGVYSHRLDNLWLAAGASNTGGAVLRQYFSDRELARLSGELRPRVATGLDYYPLPARGERFPVNDPNLAPRISPRPQAPAEFLQALMEGMAAIEARGYAVLSGLGATPPRRVLTVGGGAKNAAWRRIRERVLGLPVSRATHAEAAVGSALLARRAWMR